MQLHTYKLGHRHSTIMVDLTEKSEDGRRLVFWSRTNHRIQAEAVQMRSLLIPDEAPPLAKVLTNDGKAYLGFWLVIGEGIFCFVEE